MLDLLAGAEIVGAPCRGRARRSRTLDGATLALGAEDLVIADAAAPVALAGVMGGARTAVQRRAPRDLFFESAMFAPRVVRAHVAPATA